MITTLKLGANGKPLANCYIQSICHDDGTNLVSVGDTLTVGEKHPVNPGLTIEVTSIFRAGKFGFWIYGTCDKQEKTIGPFRLNCFIWDI